MGDHIVNRLPSIWKSVQLGSYSTTDDYLRALAAADVVIGDYAASIFDKIVLDRKNPARLNLVVLTAGELGFSEVTRYDAVSAAGIDRRLELCPAEAALELGLLCRRLPWKRLALAMKAIPTRIGEFILALETDDRGLCLLAYDGLPDRQCFPSDHFVFVHSSRSS